MYYAVMHPSWKNVKRLHEVLQCIPATDVNSPHKYFSLTALQLAVNQKEKSSAAALKAKGKGKDKGKDKAPPANAKPAEEKKDGSAKAKGSRGSIVLREKLEIQQTLLPRIEGLLVSYGASPFGAELLERHTVPPTGGLQYAAWDNPSYLPFEIKKWDVNDQTNDPLRRTVMHFVVTRGLVANDTFRWLTEIDNWKPDYTIQDDDGWTPFHEACVAGKMLAVKWFLGLSKANNSNAPGDVTRADLQPQDVGLRLLECETFDGHTPLELVEMKLKALRAKPEDDNDQSDSDSDNDSDSDDDKDTETGVSKEKTEKSKSELVLPDFADEKKNSDDAEAAVGDDDESAALVTAEELRRQSLWQFTPVDNLSSGASKKKKKKGKQEKGKDSKSKKDASSAGDDSDTHKDHMEDNNNSDNKDGDDEDEEDAEKRRYIEDLEEVRALLTRLNVHTSRWRWWHVHLKRYAWFALLLFFYGAVFPFVLVWRSLGSKLSETLLEISEVVQYSARDKCMRLTRRSLVMTAGVVVGLILPCAVILADVDPGSLQWFMLGVACSGVAFLAFVAYKARAEPRFLRLLYPEEDFQIRNTDKDRRNENLLVWFSIFIEFLQFNAFAFAPKITSFSIDTEGQVAPLAKPFRAAVLDFDLGLGVDLTYGGLWAVFGCIVAWYFCVAYLGASILVLRSGHPRERPELRQRFPFIQNDFYSHIPQSDVVVPLLTGTLFLPIIGRLVGILQCEDVNGVPILASTRDVDGVVPVVCWEGEHKSYAVASIAMLFFYVTTSVFVGVFFLDGESDGQISFTGEYELWSAFFEFLLSSFSTIVVSAIVSNSSADVGTVTDWVTLVLTCGVTAALAYMNATRCPCQHIRVVNLVRSALFAMASWTTVAAMFALGEVNLIMSGGFDYFPYILMWVGWPTIALVYLYMYRDPERFPFTREFTFSHEDYNLTSPEDEDEEVDEEDTVRKQVPQETELIATKKVSNV